MDSDLQERASSPEPLLFSPQTRVYSSDEGRSFEAVKAVRIVLVFVVVLLVFGLTMLYSTSYGVAGSKYFRNQLIWAALGIGCGTGAFLIGYRHLVNAASELMIGTFLLLLMTLFFPAINGAHRWIRIPLPGLSALSLQPSELAKVVLVLFTAKYCSANFRTFMLFRSPNGLIRFGFLILPVIGAILVGGDLGTTTLCCLTIFAMLLAGGLYLRYLLMFLPVIPIGILLILRFNAERASRITSFLDPELVSGEEGYQLWTSLLALGSGAWTGIGFMSSRMKAHYLPEAHTDFIMAIVGEELGLVGLLFVLVCYGIFAYYTMKIAISASSRVGMLTAFGLGTFISLQAIINLAAMSGAMPTKGMPAPFVSYGGTNLLVCLTAVGILLSIAADAENQDYNLRFLQFCRRVGDKLTGRNQKKEVGV
ncbi:MAG: FtsW/RodA/SpoVE family cell cycle protein [Victivallaceae bacterium]|nr:FtsW/RodA/SpoVE family cell cycle protein [Victivallaceae bacterium]